MTLRRIKRETTTWTLQNFDYRKSNGIRVTTLPSRSSVELMMVLHGVDQTWIEYDAEQLDELIRLLQSSRDALL
jgi:hypothetical protein